MPLPDGGSTPWPPPAVADVNKVFDRYGAWYSGDAAKLADAYRNTAGLATQGSELPRGQIAAPRFLASVTRGVQRAFWGTTPSIGQTKDNKLHIPLPSDIATCSADLLFGEPPEFGIDNGKSDRVKPADTKPGSPALATGPSATQKRLDEIHEQGAAQAVWLEAAETASPYGGAYLRVRWDPVIADYPLYDALPPDAGVPEWRGTSLTAVTLWRFLDRIDGKTWRHLERHEPGRVLHGVYRSGDPDKLGSRMPLDAHPQTAPFTMLLDAGSQDTVVTGATGLAVEYLPNVRPNRDMRGSPLGRSDYAGVEPVFDALDEAWSSWLRDLRLGKGRLVVPRSYIQNLGRGKGSLWDAEREVYEAVDSVASPDGGQQITIVQFAIRVDEHSRTCRELTNKAVGSAGYSPQMFGDQDTIAATATEVTARYEQSYRTRAKKLLYARGPLARIARTALEIDVAKFGTKGVTPDLPMVRFSDGVATDPGDLAQTLQLLAAAEAASIETRVRLLNPDWGDGEVMEEVDRIKDETGAVKPPPVPPPGGATTGHGPDGPIVIGGNPPDTGSPADNGASNTKTAGAGR